ncbi:DUF2937 family protein [Roseobacter weihaiensis]|uniref:DUF2937 family protein n=1 Tax=Roseobacter weihaiensis TaxID=2763262 RepID=UPI001D0BC81D|nr:DUF2937 family protein [Roseobacter sp. H9]
MILRSVVLALGLAGGLGAAQFPAYSQQYMQRLGGAVDALAQVVADFDASAAALGLTRHQALAQMQGTAFVEARRHDMEQTFTRFDVLREDLEVLQDLGPFMRAYHATRLTDREVAQGAWEAFEPALPMSFASLAFAAFGFCVSALGGGALLGMLRPGRRKRPMAA